MIRKAVLPFVFVCLLFVGSCLVRADAFECSFEFSDANASAGRNFDTTLRIKSDAKIASFIGEISFDDTEVEYKEAKTKYSEASVSVNSNEKGKITFVFLCEDGVACCDDTDVLEFTFKAKNAGESEISLAFRDVIDCYGNDVSAGLSEGASVRITGSVKATDTEGADSSAYGSVNQAPYGSNSTDVKGNSVNIYLAGSAFAAAVVALIVTAYVFYKLGVRKKEKEGVENEEET